MKSTILLLSLMFLVSCEGIVPSAKESGSSDDGDNAVVELPIEIEYNSMGSYQVTGISLDLMGTFDEQRALVIPQFIDKVQDTASSLRMGDVARIKFVDTVCNYAYDGTSQFVFQFCNGALSSYVAGDTIYLHDLHNPMNAQRDGQIDFGLVRPSNDNHTGTIKIKTTL